MPSLQLELRRTFYNDPSFLSFLEKQGLDLVVNVYKERGVRYFDVVLRDGRDIASYIRASFHEPPVEIDVIGYKRPRSIDVHVKSVNVYPSYRRKGHATALMRGLCKWLDDRCLVAFLDMQSQSESVPSEDLAAFYKKSGFVVLEKSVVDDIASMERKPGKMPGSASCGAV